ncbi:MAG TPA: hypothetical protein VID72_12270 [Ktedonobacterales bacterium]
MYKFRRLRALIQMLSVTTMTRRRVFLRWLWVVLGYAVAISVALADIFRTSHDWPITWHDMLLLDKAARSFLLASFIAFVSGYYMLTWMLFSSRLATKQMLPSPDMAHALRKAAQNRDARIVTVVQLEQSPSGDASDSALAPTSVHVASPQLLTRSVWLAIAVCAAGLIPLTFIIFLFWSITWAFASQTPDPAGGATFIYTMLRFAGMFAPLLVIAFVNTRRYWIGWRTRVRAADVTISALGLTIRDCATLWRRRFIAWDDAVSFVCFTYKDGYAHPRTVYLLDSGVQTLLWEMPPDMRYDPPARRKLIADQQAQSARLVALIATATKLPLLDITGVIGALAKVEPNPYTTSEAPDSRDVELLEFVEGVSSPKALNTLSPPPTRTEQWHRLLLSGLVGFAFIAGSVLFFGGLGQ